MGPSSETLHKNRLRDHVGTTADDLLRRPSRQSRARSGHICHSYASLEEMIASRTRSASTVPSASPFSKSCSVCAIVFVTWARQRTFFLLHCAKAYSAAASISTASTSLVRAAALASPASRKRASALQLEPTPAFTPLRRSADSA